MKHKKLLSLLLAVCMVLALLPTVAFAEETLFYTLDGAITGGTNGYATESEITQDDMSWMVTGNTTTNPWRIGGKNLTKVDRPVYSTTPMGAAITMVDLFVGSSTLTNVHSIKLIVASDASFTNVLDTVTKDFTANSIITFKPSSGNAWATDSYYKFVFNVTAGGSNSYVQFIKADFYYDNSGTVPQPAYTVTPATNNSSWGTVAMEGSVITATPEEGYYAAGYTVSPEGAATVVQNGNTFTVSNVTGDCTVTINFAAKTQVTVSFDGNGATSGTMADVTVYQEDPYTLPACAFEKTGNVFIGWTIDGGDGSVLAAGDEVNLTGNTTFVAQWAEVNTYTKITSMDEYVNGCEYLLVVASKSLAFVGNSNDGGNTVAVTIVNDSTIVGNYDANEITLLIAADGSYSLKNAEGKYLSNSSGATVAFGDSARAHSIEFKEDGTAWICDTTTNKYISYNPNSPGYLRYYNNTYEKVTLFKKVGGSYVEPPTPVQTCTVSFDGNEGTGNMASITKEVGTEYTIPANKFTAPQGMRFIGWKINNEGELLKPDDVITIEEDIVLFAQWQEIVLTDMELKSELNTGDTVVIYYPTGKKIMTGEDYFYNNSNHELASDSATLSDGILAVPDTALRLTVSINNDGRYTFATSDGRYLYADDTDVKLVNEQGANTLFQLEAAEAGEGSYYIKCDSATYNDNAEYIEFYANYFTVRTFNNDNADIYTFQFYAEPEPETLENGFYLIGQNGWTVDDIDATQKFGVNLSSSGEYVLATTLAENDEIKVVKVENGAIVGWWPDGLDNQYHVDNAHAGKVNIYFRETYNNDWRDFGGYFYIEAGYDIVCVPGENGLVSTTHSRAAEGTTVTIYLEASEGYVPDTLTVMCGETAVATNKVNDWQYTFVMPKGDVTITATFAIPATEPTFKSQSLILDGMIGVSFNMELPEMNGVDYATSYMTFSIAHGTCTERVDYSAATAKRSNQVKGFVCNVNSIQMAEPITATFHYTENGEEKTVVKTYSVKDYFEAYDKNKSQFDATTQALIESLADYGHYVQAMLAKQKGWTLGTSTTYAEMDKFYTTSYDIGTISGEVANKGLTFENDGAELSKLTFTVVFDSATELRLLFKTPSTGPITATVNGNSVGVTTLGSSKAVQIKNIPAHLLSKPNTVVITIDGHNVTITASALSYAKLLLAANDTTMQNAGAALYNYSAAADAFKAAH